MRMWRWEVSWLFRRIFFINIQLLWRRNNITNRERESIRLINAREWWITTDQLKISLSVLSLCLCYSGKLYYFSTIMMFLCFVMFLTTVWILELLMSDQNIIREQNCIAFLISKNKRFLCLTQLSYVKIYLKMIDSKLL